MLTRLAALVLILLVAQFVRAAERPVDLGPVTEKHEMVPMRDGKRLSTYLYFPAGKGRWPVLYEQRYADLRSAGSRKALARLAGNGYVVAAQNFRGTHLSEGDWVGYRALGWGTQQDGFDTVEWLAQQPWSSGKIGTMGGSQAGFAQNFLAVTRPPHLVAQYMTDTGLSLFQEGYRIGGATRPERFKQMDAVCRVPQDNRRLLAEWFAHPTYDDYWRQEDCTLHIDQMNVPCFSLGSWFDFMCVGSVESYIGRQHRGGPNSRGKQQLLIGPWAHGGAKDNHVGELSYPANATFALQTHLVRWFDHYLKGVENGVENEPAVRYYVMGATGEPGAPGNVWRSATDWPVPARETAYYLHADGTLFERLPTVEKSSTEMRADPLHPNEIPGRAFPGARDARPFEKQAEVRTFSSERLTHPVEWTGKVKAELYVTSSAKDTDFIVRVSDVYPDGRSILLMDYIRRARYREGYDQEVFLEPGEICKMAFDVGWISQIFNVGHRIRVTVASTGAPFYEPNPNTGEPLTIEFPAKTVVAINAVYHDRQHASRVIAPLCSSDDKRAQLERGRGELNARLAKLRANSDLYADVAVFAKGLSWALRHDKTVTPADAALETRALEQCLERVAELEAGRTPWVNRKGKLVRGYVSSVDGSVQPFGLIVPAGYDAAKPTRLDVVLHGSSKSVGMSELRFMSRFDEDGKASAPDVNYIELHPLGRVENCYRWAGETDVFEAMEAVCRNYHVDRDRIVLRGMSMGASGTWHVGLKYPDRFVALGPYSGYVDTHEFSRTPQAHFVKVGELPPHQEKALHMLDSVDYAANAGIVPSIACMGEKDVFFQAHVIMGRAMEREGLKMVNLVSWGTGHVIDPVTHAEQMRRIADYAAKGIDHFPKHLRFITWTLKYSRCHWLQILGLDEHYARAELQATVKDDGSVDVMEPKNITRFAILDPALQSSAPKLRVAGQVVPLPVLDAGSGPRQSVIGKRDGGWAYLGELGTVKLVGKRPGLQGPIDDAFATRFLCVRGTGQAWNPAVQAWADASLKRFAGEWDRYFRGELPIKNDSDVTAEDVRSSNLILFGDPGSNRWIAQVLPGLPLVWTKQELVFGGANYSAADHAVLLIHPNPLASDRYVVLNSGHTFGEQELASLNYLLFPRLGDWAVLNVPSRELVHAGFFDEQWRVAGRPAR
jgi:predicted acyl esterase/poly(3-hydroxybutyrate) depolymerase